MLALAQWLDGTAVSQGIQKILWLIPVLQTIHILAIAAVLSSAGMIELRILGITESTTITQTANRFVPWLWSGLLVLALTGIVLIIGEPKRALPNPAFHLKMILLAAAIVATLRLRNGFWEEDTPARRLTRALAIGIFAVWCAIAFAGRWIAYAD
jgi:hypothetical protein